MSEINIKYISDETLETLKSNLDDYIEFFVKYPNDHNWINSLTEENTYVLKKHTINDFKLIIPKAPNDKEAELANSIMLYESIKKLPMYVLSDERFWCWINFEKGYEVALKMMPVENSKSVIKDHWLFTQGKRRGLFFGVLSRAFLRVKLTVDYKSDDMYELTRFVIEKPERFRNLSWRTFSSNPNILLGTLKAQKKIYEEYGDIEKAKYFTEIAKYVSKLGSVMLLDAMDENDIMTYVYDYYKCMVDDEKNCVSRLI